MITFLFIFYFFRYFKEYQSNPSKIGARQYTPLAEWKFREFNEVEHLFKRRLNMSDRFAARYLDQFPKVKMAHIARFIAFVAGAITSILVLATLMDPELFLSFEITPDRTVLFYVTIIGTVWGLSNGSLPEENTVFDPEYALLSVIEYTHYRPKHWEDRLHSDEVKKEFSVLYQLKIMVFVEEVLSIIITPFILWYSLPKCSDQIIDFFREFTIHVDGVGYVCSFAVFDFKKGVGNTGNQHAGTANDVRDDYYSTKHGKMAASYYGFLDNYQMNPETGIPGHFPPGMRQQFHPPPPFPGLMSPTLGGGLQDSRMGRSERRRRSRGPSGMAPRTPRFSATGVHDGMTSILLDPHHQPSTSGFATRRTSRSRYQPRAHIIEEPIEDEEEAETTGDFKDQYDSEPGLGGSRWETSPTRDSSKEDDEGGGEVPVGGGVLGLLYQNLKAHTATGRPGVNI
jgi:autophagy-related protein 9